jgi:hypothetical protein
MKLIKKSLLLILLAGVFTKGYGREMDPLMKSYCDAMKQLSTQCMMTYTAVCQYPDQSRQTVAGRLAIQGRNYYDSSNARFVLMNNTWLVMAEHQARLINIVNLPQWRKEMGKDFELDISGYLLNNASLDDFSTFKVSPKGKDSFAVHVQYDLDDGQMIDLVLHYAKNDKVPAWYEGSFAYPMPDESDIPDNGSLQYLKVRFECWNISKTVDASLFDDRRLIRSEQGKAYMKRYNHYKMYRRSKS